MTKVEHAEDRFVRISNTENILFGYYTSYNLEQLLFHVLRHV